MVPTTVLGDGIHSTDLKILSCLSFYFLWLGSDQGGKLCLFNLKGGVFRETSVLLLSLQELVMSSGLHRVFMIYKC